MHIQVYILFKGHTYFTDQHEKNRTSFTKIRTDGLNQDIKQNTRLYALDFIVIRNKIASCIYHKVRSCISSSLKTMNEKSFYHDLIVSALLQLHLCSFLLYLRFSIGNFRLFFRRHLIILAVLCTDESSNKSSIYTMKGYSHVVEPI